MCLDVFENLIAFALKEFSQLTCLKMALGSVGKVIVHRCKQTFDIHISVIVSHLLTYFYMTYMILHIH